MQNLKSDLLIIVFLFILSACQTGKVFEIETFPASPKSNQEDLQVIRVKSDRVQQECLFYNAEGENKWRHQYSMYILNDKNEALEIMQSTNQDKETCQKQLKKIEKILRKEPKVYLCVRDQLKKESDRNAYPTGLVNFGALGKFKITYETLWLDSVCNSKECFSNNSVWANTCPGFVKHE